MVFQKRIAVRPWRGSINTTTIKYEEIELFLLF